MDKMDIIISFDDVISDQYFVEKNHQIFFAKKKLSQIFIRVPPLELAWNLMLPQKGSHFKMLVCNYCKGSPLLNCHFFWNSKN